MKSSKNNLSTEFKTFIVDAEGLTGLRNAGRFFVTCERINNRYHSGYVHFIADAAYPGEITNPVQLFGSRGGAVTRTPQGLVKWIEKNHPGAQIEIKNPEMLNS